jgi:protein SCO1/2
MKTMNWRLYRLASAPRLRKTLLIALSVALAALLAWLACVWQPAGGAAPGAEAPAGAHMRLEGKDGPVAIADFRGKVVIVYFGYTFCPDICPTSLSTIAQALNSLTAEELQKVRSVLITVDPERDTIAALSLYAPFFHPSIIGLRGTPQQLAEVAASYGARYMKQKADADGQYSIDHSSLFHLIAADGKPAAALPLASTAQDLAKAIRAQLREAK